MDYILYLFILFPWLKPFLIGYLIYHIAGGIFIAPGIIVFKGKKFFFLTLPLQLIPGFKSIMKLSFGGENPWDIFLEFVSLAGALLLPFLVSLMLYPHLPMIALIGLCVVGTFMSFAAMIFNIRYNILVITEFWKEWKNRDVMECEEDEIAELVTQKKIERTDTFDLYKDISERSE